MRAYDASRQASQVRRCSVALCGRHHKGHGLCSMHLRQHQKSTGEWKPAPSDAWDNQTRRAKYKYRKALTRGAPTGDGRFTVTALLDRDGRDCGICGENIPHVEYPHPLSPSIDHIVPLSKRGPHTLTNARATHLVCNVRRGARD